MIDELHIPGDFPSQPVIDAYLQPNVERSRESFTWGDINWEALKRFALERLNWPYHKTDQYLEPLRRNLHAQQRETRQQSIDSYFGGSTQRAQNKIPSKRIESAVEMLKQRRRAGEQENTAAAASTSE
jgi:DNA excision repair protein ERCC-5